MPALVLFHRRTIFGGDDLQPTAIVTILVRVIQITLLCIPILHYTISHLVDIIQQQQQQQDRVAVGDSNHNVGSTNDYSHSGWMIVQRLVMIAFDTTATTTTIASDMNLDTDQYTATTDSSSNSNNINNRSLTSSMYRCADSSDLLYGDTTASYSDNDDDDSEATTWKLFYIVLTIWSGGTILYNIGSIVLEQYIIYWSGHGTPTTQMQSRSYHIQQLLFIKLIPGTILLGLLSCTALFGIIAYYIIPQQYFSNTRNRNYTDHTNCDYLFDTVGGLGTSFRHTDEPIRSSLWWIAVVILLLAQITEAFVSILFTYQLFQLPLDEGVRGTSYHVVSERTMVNDSDHDTFSQQQQQLNYNHELVEEMWAKRCEATCHCLSVSTCYMFGGRNLVDVVGRSAPGNTGGPTSHSSHSIFVDVARALADFLESRGVLDVVPSDIVTGLILLQRIQRQRVYTARQQYKARINEVETGQYHDESSNAMMERVESGILEDNILINDDMMPTGNTKTLPTSQNETAKTIRKRSSSKSLQTSGNIQIDDSGLLIRNRNRSKSPDHAFLLPMEPGITSVSRNHLREDGASSESPATHGEQRYHQQNGLHSYYRMNANGSGYQREERALLNRSDFTELYLLDEAARYAKYALAIYTWVLYLYEHPVTGPFRLFLRKGSTLCVHQGDCRTGRHRAYEQPDMQQQQFTSNEVSPNESLMSFIDENGRIEGDNLCQTHKNAILLTAGLQEADIVYVQLRSSLSDIPYCILLDHTWKSIVVSIRGTFSIEDCITDVLITPESLEKLGIDFGFDAIDEYCHGGVMACARNVYRDLDRHGLLDKLLLGENAKYSGYTLRVVGHSLGAATSTLLSYMLKHKHSNLRCINYSPPGCTFTWRMATQCKDWCTSCVLDTDLVPRLTVESIERLRDEILDLIGRIKVPKALVAQRFTESTFRQCRNDNDKDVFFKDDLADVLFDPDEVPDTEYQQQLIRFKEIQDERRQHRGTSRAIQLYPPGRILHLIKTGEKRSCTAGMAKILTCCTTNIGSTYIPVWVDNDDLNEIVVGPRMGTDHFPNRIRAILQEVAAGFGL